MKRYRTVNVPIPFSRPGEDMTRSRCFIEWSDHFQVHREPTSEPHRWAVAEIEVTTDVQGFALVALRFVCTRCAENHYEERPLEDGEDPLQAVPRTVVNWDGSPPVMAE